MAEFDDFSDHLLEESKRFFEKSTEGKEQVAKDAYLHASLMLAFSALEARVNSISEEATLRTDISEHERAFLREKDIRLEDGEFKIHNSLKIGRLEDRIEFLCVRLSGTPRDKTTDWWGDLKNAIKLRNELTHPKSIPMISDAAVSNALEAIVNTFDELSKAIYNKPYPGARTGLASRLQF